MGYDLGRFESKKFAEEGVDFQLVHPITGPVVDDSGAPVTMKIGGADSPRIKAAVRERQKARQKALEKAQEAGIEFEYDREQDAIDDLVLLTFGWSTNLEMNGVPFPYSAENAQAIYRRFPEIAEQMTAKARQRINFMLNALTKLSPTPTTK